MKIVHLVPALTKGGGERVAVDLANAAAAAGHDVTMIAAFKVDEGLLTHQLSPLVTLRYIVDHAPGRVRRYASGLSWIWRERDWLAHQDIVHCHLAQAALLGTALHGLLNRQVGERRPAIVETYHAVGMPIPNRQRAWHAWLASRRDGMALMAQDPYWAAFRRDHPDIVTQIIPNGVDARQGRAAPDKIAAWKTASGIPQDARLLVGTVGQFRAERKPAQFAEMFIAAARRTPSDVHFTFVGDGPERAGVIEHIRASGLADRIHLPGIALDPHIPMSAMDLYCTLNVGPITGIAALEAAFAGVPIMALQNVAEYTPRPDDWIWSDQRPDKVVDEIVRLAGDREARSMLATRQSGHARNTYSVETMWNAYADFYEQARTSCRS